ncbi:MAG: hypothetical protein KBE09_04110 [Candidatus Pacebacteria bacterium]|nr:hypothetical protein [Candidatus Paceibacterota bacterium]
MQTDFPTTELYFVFAYTYCKLRVYTSEESLARKLLQMHGVEFLEWSDGRAWQHFDTRILLRLLSDSLPQFIERALPSADEAATKLQAFIKTP